MKTLNDHLEKKCKKKKGSCMEVWKREFGDASGF